jgi:tetratricopeptide (TPR) repeat protein
LDDETQSSPLESVDYYHQTVNKYGLSTTYAQLAFACFSQGKYDDALKTALVSYTLHKNNRDETAMCDMQLLIAQIHLKRGEFVQGFEAAQEALQLATRLGDKVAIHSCLISFGSICMGIEDYPLALDYYRSYFQHYSPEDSVKALKDESSV